MTSHIPSHALKHLLQSTSFASFLLPAMSFLLIATPDKEHSENKEKGETDNSVNFETGHGPVEFFLLKAMILHTACQNKVRARWFSIDDGTMQSLWGNVQVAIQFCIYPDVA